MKLKLAQNLRKLRLEKGLTQEQLSEKMGVSCQAVSRWETGTTYPDIEMLPALADLFDVSLEKLMGVTKTEREEASQEYYDRLNRTLGHEERLKLLYEIHHEFPNDMTIVWNLCGETDDLDEQRKFTEELIERAADDESIRVYAEQAIAWLINAEAEDKLLPFLNKHTAPLKLSRELRLEERYMRRTEWDTYELTNSSLWASKSKLAVIDLLSGTSGMNPVSGDGIPDLWFHARFDAGLRYACHLSGSGESEAALEALEDLTGLYEKFWSLPDQTVLTFRCPALDRIEGVLHHCYLRGPAAGPDYKDTTHNARVIVYNTDERDPMWSHWMYQPLLFDQGWEWFDPIRDDPQYAHCIERMKAFVKEGIWNPEG